MNGDGLRQPFAYPFWLLGLVLKIGFTSGTIVDISIQNLRLSSEG